VNRLEQHSVDELGAEHHIVGAPARRACGGACSRRTSPASDSQPARTREARQAPDRAARDGAVREAGEEVKATRRRAAKGARAVCRPRCAAGTPGRLSLGGRGPLTRDRRGQSATPVPPSAATWSHGGRSSGSCSRRSHPDRAGGTASRGSPSAPTRSGPAVAARPVPRSRSSRPA
jgi:hypothetical protein